AGDAHDDLSYPLSGRFEDGNAGVVFAGYGIADDKLGYNDYAELAKKGISIEGKWLLILADEPLLNAETSLLPTPDHKPSKWSQFLSKRSALLTRGKPKGLLVITDSSKRMQGSFADAAAAAALNARRVGALSIYKDSSAIQAYAVSTRFPNQILPPTPPNLHQLPQSIA